MLGKSTGRKGGVIEKICRVLHNNERLTTLTSVRYTCIILLESTFAKRLKVIQLFPTAYLFLIFW